jgi:hypothetical protein
MVGFSSIEFLILVLLIGAPITIGAIILAVVFLVSRKNQSAAPMPRATHCPHCGKPLD